MNRRDSTFGIIFGLINFWRRKAHQVNDWQWLRLGGFVYVVVVVREGRANIVVGEAGKDTAFPDMPGNGVGEAGPLCDAL